MNRVFLLIPAIGGKDAGQDIAYLKQLGKIEREGVLSILRQIVRSLRLVEGEEIETLYDEKHFKQLFRKLKQRKASQEMPQLENLLLFFNDAVSIQQRGIGKTSIAINGMTVDRGLVNAFVDESSVGKVLLNRGALIDPEQPIDVKREDGERQSLHPLPCEAADVYLWLVENRTPNRQLDPSYHAMEVATDDTEEIVKIYKRGGRGLMKRIEDTSNLA